MASSTSREYGLSRPAPKASYLKSIVTSRSWFSCPGVLLENFRLTPSSGWMRKASTLRSRPPGNRPSGGFLKTTAISVTFLGSRLPVRIKNGTPCQRQFSISSLIATKVGVLLPPCTPGSSR